VEHLRENLAVADLRLPPSAVADLDGIAKPPRADRHAAPS
jgi:aryl-alcohol dehydrogenase-like predicted oxidoreductase